MAMLFNFQGSQLKFLLPAYRNFPCFLSGSLYKIKHTTASCQCIFQALCLYLLRLLDFFPLCLSTRKKEMHLMHSPQNDFCIGIKCILSPFVTLNPCILDQIYQLCNMYIFCNVKTPELQQI